MRLLNSWVFRRRSNRPLVATAAFGILAQSSVLLSDSSTSDIGGCTVLVAQARPSPQQQPEQRPAQRPPVEQPSGGAPKAPSDALRAPQEKELTDLGGVLKAMASAETAPATLAALRAGKPFSFERFGVLVADVRSIVVLLDARELRARLSKNKEVNAETRPGIDQSVGVMEGCAPGRFENRGGPTVFEQVTALVQKHRSQLEPFLFQSVAPQDATPAIPPNPRKGQ
jgi:hypothetical protein